MAPLVIDVRADDTRDAVHRAVQALAEGQIVAFPTETVYGLAVSGQNAEAVARLADAKGRDAKHPFALAIKSLDDALDYVPAMPPLAQRLARRCWPGPLTLVVAADDQEDSLVQQLPAEVRTAVCPEGTLGLRVPAHAAILSTLRLIAGPLVLTSANPSGGEEALTAEAVAESMGEHVSVILDDGRCHYGQASSVVKVEENRWTMLRSGVITPARMNWFTNLLVLFVCTGNTCRSPMAERLFRARAADRLGCKGDELEEKGVMVMSAGIAAMEGGRPSQEAIDVMKKRGLDLNDHASQPLNDQLVRFADCILTMTRGHQHAILAQWPEAAPRTHLLRQDRGDIADPIGGPLEMYAECATQIDLEIGHWIRDLGLDDLPQKVGD